MGLNKGELDSWYYALGLMWLNSRTIIMGWSMKKLFGFLMVGLAFTALQVAMVADAHAFSTQQDMGVGLKFKDMADTVVPVTANSAVKEMERVMDYAYMVHNKQCAKIEDSDGRTNCLNATPTPQEIEQGRAEYDACVQDAGQSRDAQMQCSDIGDVGGGN